MPVIQLRDNDTNQVLDSKRLGPKCKHADKITVGKLMADKLGRDVRSVYIYRDGT